MPIILCLLSENSHFQGQKRVLWGDLMRCRGCFNAFFGVFLMSWLAFFDTLKLPPQGSRFLQVADYQRSRETRGAKRDNWDKRHPIFFPLLKLAEGGDASAKQLVVVVI